MKQFGSASQPISLKSLFALCFSRSRGTKLELLLFGGGWKCVCGFSISADCKKGRN